MIAYVNIATRGNRNKDVLEALKQFEQVKEAAIVWGSSDVVARIETQADGLDELADIVIGRVQQLEGVEQTRTLIVIKDLYWSR